VMLRSHVAYEYLKGVADRINAGGKSIEVTTEVVECDQPARAIADRCRREDVGLVVMATRGRGGSRLVLGSVADRLLEIELPALLFVRPSDRGALAPLQTRQRAEPVVHGIPVLVP
jgi:nucleotide-binding universal stress UspA family protein